MIIPVYMFAFADEGDRSMIRPVEIPTGEAESARMVEGLLELVFRYGQNEIQSKKFPSVSVGDVADINGRYFMALGTGWQELTKDEFDNLKTPTSWYAYGFNAKKAIKKN